MTSTRSNEAIHSVFFTFSSAISSIIDVFLMAIKLTGFIFSS